MIRDLKMRFKTRWAAFLLIAAILVIKNKHAPGQQDVKLQWLSDRLPAYPTGISWGVPWPEGEVQRDAQFKLETAQGYELPVQSWSTAYWPHGFVKWSGLATIADTESEGPLTLSIVDRDNKQDQDQPVDVHK